MEMRGMMGGFYKISEWIMRFSAINLLWVVTSIPFLFLFLNSYLLLSDHKVTNAGEMVSYLLPCFIIAPFCLFPSTAAMFSVARKWVMGQEDVPLFKTFFSNYKSNYVQSMMGGIVYVLLTLVFIVNINFYNGSKGFLSLLSIVFIALFVLLTVSVFNFFNILVHFHMKFLQILKSAILITIGRLITSFMIAVTCGAVLLISFKFTFLLPFFSFSIMAFLSFWHFYRVYSKLMDQKEREELEKQEPEKQESDKLDLDKHDQDQSLKEDGPGSGQQQV